VKPKPETLAHLDEWNSIQNQNRFDAGTKKF